MSIIKLKISIVAKIHGKHESSESITGGLDKMIWILSLNLFGRLMLPMYFY